jgi:hypothetical protein
MSALPLNRPNHQPVIDVSREDLLSAVIPGFTADKPQPRWAVGGVFPRPRPRIRNHWTHLRQWHSFGQDVVDYWTQVPLTDKSALVESQDMYRWLRGYYHRSNGSEIYADRLIQDYRIMYLHNAVATGVWDRSPPSDRHSRWAMTELDMAGSPQLAMYSMDGDNRLTAWMLTKSPWEVTPQDIDQIINGIPVFIPLTSRRVCNGQGTSCTPCPGKTVWVYGS